MEVFSYLIRKYLNLKNDKTILEQQPLEKLASINQLSSYLHLGSWFSMDTQRDQVYLDKLYKSKNILVINNEEVFKCVICSGKLKKYYQFRKTANM